MSGISRGLHFWQPALKLNNTPMAGIMSQPRKPRYRVLNGLQTFNACVQRCCNTRKRNCIHWMQIWQPIYYCFICMLISLVSLVTMCKIEKSFYSKMRPVRLIDIHIQNKRIMNQPPFFHLLYCIQWNPGFFKPSIFQTSRLFKPN